MSARRIRFLAGIKSNPGGISADKFHETEFIGKWKPSFEGVRIPQHKVHKIEAAALWDEAIKRRNMGLLWNTLCCVALVITLMQVEWDPGSRHLQTTPTGITIRIVLLILTIIAVIQVFEYYGACVREALAEHRDSAAEAKKQASVRSLPVSPGQATPTLERRASLDGQSSSFSLGEEQLFRQDSSTGAPLVNSGSGVVDSAAPVDLFLTATDRAPTVATLRVDTSDGLLHHGLLLDSIGDDSPRLQRSRANSFVEAKSSVERSSVGGGVGLRSRSVSVLPPNEKGSIERLSIDGLHGPLFSFKHNRAKEAIDKLKTNIEQLPVTTMARTQVEKLKKTKVVKEMTERSKQVRFEIDKLGVKIRDVADKLPSRIQSEIDVDMWIILKSTNIPRAFLLELLVCLPHPFPGLPELPSKVFAMLVFLRLYIIWKVLRDRSVIYRKRKIIEHIPGYSPHAHPNFNSLLSMKFFFYQRPILLISIAIVTTSFLFAYAIYIFERGSKVDPETGELVFTFWICYYLGLSTLVTGWPTDIWSLYMQATWVGKFVSIGASVFGLAMFALLIDYLHTKMQPTNFERSALEWVIRRKWEQKERIDAARLIQIFWRHYRYKAMRKSLGAVDEQEDRKRRYLFSLEWLKQVETIRAHRGKKLRDLGMRGFIDTRQHAEPASTVVTAIDERQQQPQRLQQDGSSLANSDLRTGLMTMIDRPELDEAQLSAMIRQQVQQAVKVAVAEQQQEMERTLKELQRVTGLLSELSAKVAAPPAPAPPPPPPATSVPATPTTPNFGTVVTTPRPSPRAMVPFTPDFPGSALLALPPDAALPRPRSASPVSSPGQSRHVSQLEAGGSVGTINGRPASPRLLLNRALEFSRSQMIDTVNLDVEDELDS